MYQKIGKYVQATKYFEAAKEKFPAALYYLGLIYLREDSDKAYRYRKEAFEKGFTILDEEEWKNEDKRLAGSPP